MPRPSDATIPESPDAPGSALETTEPTATPDPKAHEVTLRDVELAELARLLRGAVGLPSNQAGPGERAAAYRRPLPRVIPSVDVHGWIAWALVGLPLFERGLPTLERTRGTAKTIVLVLALARVGGNISAAGLALATSRKTLRDNMRRYGLYPFARAPKRRP